MEDPQDNTSGKGRDPTVLLDDLIVVDLSRLVSGNIDRKSVV